jgi:antitoxin (DNA-binding transcriptional repressor) of toxin-antitoxin stability system
MSKHSVVEAKNRLSELIDRALEGEEVVITRHGRAVVELRALPKPPRRISAESIEWLSKRRVGKPAEIDAGTLVSRIRDEDWH